jgi:hypothetical protein
MLLPQLQTVFRLAFARLRPLLAADPDELRARLARRRQPTFHRPLRSWCVALRANDTRINPCHAVLVPDHAIDPDSPFHPGQFLSHTVHVNARLVRLVCQRVDISAPGEPWYDIAPRLGVKRLGLRGLRKQPAVEVRPVANYANRRGRPVPFIYVDSPLDPAAHGKHPPDPIFGGLWAFLPDSIPDAFAQTLTRIPRLLPYGRDRQTHTPSHPHTPAPPTSDASLCPTRFFGWRWLCPACDQPAKTLFYPLSPPDWSHLLALPLPADESALDIAPPPSFACERCHDVVRFCRAQLRKSWGQLVLRLSGGLLFGHEVPMPDSLTPQRKQAYHPRPRRSPRRDRLAHLLATTDLSFDQIGHQLGLKPASAARIAQIVYQQHNVHSRAQLRALSPPPTPTSDLQPPNSDL